MVASGSGGTADQGKLVYSYDGTTWLIGTATGIFTACNSIAWNGFIWVAGGESNGSGRLAYSVDGINWTQATTAGTSFTVCNIVAWCAYAWVAGCTGTNVIIFSSNGITWEESKTVPDFTYGCTALTFIGNKLVACGEINSKVAVFESSDGDEWVELAPPQNGGPDPFDFTICNTIVSNGTDYFAGGSGGTDSKLATSIAAADTWVKVTGFPARFIPNSLGWNESRWVAVGEGATSAGDATVIGKIAYSLDGIIWTGVANIFDYF
jgi:hypothetical protein